MSTVNIDFKADASSVVAAASKTNAALASIGTSADNASKKITPAFGNLTGGAQKAASALGPLGGVLSKISPEAGAAASSIAGAASAATGLGEAMVAASGSATLLEAAMGPVGWAVAAVSALVAGAVLVYRELQSQAEESAKAQLVLAASADAVAAAEGRIADAKYRLKVATGTATAEDARAQAVKRENLKTEAEALAAGHLVFQLEKEVREANDAGAIKAGIDAQARLDEAKKSQKAVQDAGAEAAKLAGDEAEYAFEAQVEGEREAARRAEKTAGDKAATDAAHALKAAIDAVAAAERALLGITQASTESTLDAMGKEDDAYHQKNLAIEANREAALKALQDMGAGEEAYAELQARVLDAQTAAQHEHELNVVNINKKKEKDRQDALDKEQKEYEDFLAKQASLDKQAQADSLSAAAEAWGEKKAVAEEYYSAATKLGGLFVSATSKDYDTTTEAGKEAATKQFNAQKAVAVALSIAQGALAVVQAIGSAPPPFNIPAIVATGIAVTAETAAIMATQPKFHTGTTGFRPDEGGATLQRGEGVVTSAGMSKPGMKEAVAAANSGRTPGGTGGSMNMVYQHKVYNEFIRDNLKAGSPLTRRIDNGTKVGHRQSRR